MRALTLWLTPILFASSLSSADETPGRPDREPLPISEELYSRALQGMTFSGTDEVCANRMGRAVFAAMNARFIYDETGIESANVVNVQPITGQAADFDFISLFRVSGSDETDPSAWLVVIDKEDCVIESITAGSDSSL